MNGVDGVGSGSLGCFEMGACRFPALCIISECTFI